MQMPERIEAYRDGDGSWSLGVLRDESDRPRIVIAHFGRSDSERDFAKELARRWNAHGALLAVARGLSEWEADPDGYAGDLADLAHSARAAIAEAEGKPHERREP